jgi:hypothetical protein
VLPVRFRSQALDFCCNLLGMRNILATGFVAVFLIACSSHRPVRPPTPPVPQPPAVKAELKSKAIKLRITRFKIGGVQAVGLAWDPSPDPDVTGYRIYQGPQSRIYTNIVDAGSQTTLTITSLDPGGQYYFTCTAYVAPSGPIVAESDYSNEVTYQAPLPTYVVGVQLLSSPTTTGPWTVYATLPPVTIPDPGTPIFFQSILTITNQ